MLSRCISSLPVERRFCRRPGSYYLLQLWRVATSLKKSRGHLEFLFLLIISSFILNVILTRHVYQCSLPMPFRDALTNAERADPLSTVERSTRALEQLKELLESVRLPDDPAWIWTPSSQYPSVPYQPTSLRNRTIPKALTNVNRVPQVVTEEISRVCERLKRAHPVGGEIWCVLFNVSYSDTLARTTSLLDDHSTFIITGDIDLMWLRDSR